MKSGAIWDLGNLMVEISWDGEALGGTLYKSYNVFTFCLLVKSGGQVFMGTRNRECLFQFTLLLNAIGMLKHKIEKNPVKADCYHMNFSMPQPFNISKKKKPVQQLHV